MQVADGVAMLDIPAVIMGKVNVIHPSLIWDKDEVILVDTGYPGQLPLFREAMEKAGVPFLKLSKVIVTHQDLDHIGGLPAILYESSQRVEVLASEVAKPFIQGEKRLVKMTPDAVARALDSLPAGVPEERCRAFKFTLENPPRAGVDKTVDDGEELPYCGGVIVISTPGHTPGHICLYHKASKTLVAGDALIVVEGRLAKIDPQLNLDTDEAGRSLKKLTRYDIETVICYHGGLYQGDTNLYIAELAQT